MSATDIVAQTLPPFSNRRMKALLRALGACSEGRDWLGDRDLETAWNDCERGDWSLWLVARVNVDRRLIVRAAARCAKTALQFVPEGEDRPRLAIEAAFAWADDPSEVNLQRCREAARNAATAYATDAAYAAYDAAYAAYAAAYAAYDAAYAAAYAAAYDAAYAAAYAAAKEDERAWQAARFRAYLEGRVECPRPAAGSEINEHTPQTG
mgnify:CR=1 FL=1